MSTLTLGKINKYVDYQISKSGNPNDRKRLEQLKELLLNRQFKEAPTGISIVDYSKWLKDAKNTFLLSIPTQSLLMGDIHHYPMHSKDELNEPVIGSLSPNQIIQILDSIDLYTILKLITDDIRYDKINDDLLGNDRLIGMMQGSELIAYPNHSFNRSDSLYGSYNKRNGVKSINNRNAYEVLYSFLRLPISVVLASINEVNTHIPCGLFSDDELCKKIDMIQRNADSRYHFVRSRK